MRGKNFKQQLPEPDDAAKVKLHKLLAAGTILSVMNKTKWAELIEAMLRSPQVHAACLVLNSSVFNHGFRPKRDLRPSKEQSLFLRRLVTSSPVIVPC